MIAVRQKVSAFEIDRLGSLSALRHFTVPADVAFGKRSLGLLVAADDEADMIDHTGIGVVTSADDCGLLRRRRPPRSPTGHRHSEDDGAYGIGHGDKDLIFWIDPPPSTACNIPLLRLVSSRRRGRRLHTVVLQAGGTDNGLLASRSGEGYSPGYYAAFVRDPNGTHSSCLWCDGTLVAIG